RISFTSGISDNWRALHFPGGEIGENVVSLPESLFASDSYTIAFWVYPEDVVNWASAIYKRYNGGFISYVPYSSADEGISLFRIAPDDDMFYDATGRHMPQYTWTHVCIVYDITSESLRYFIDDRKNNYLENMPIQLGCGQILLGGDPFQKSFVGKISALRIYDYAMTDKEIAELYRSYLSEPGFSGNIDSDRV
ncbi:MAG: LamG domain-containing protein, partial [Lachnospiraceae bacterium]|nr:LamG domain-containing protein [Lachnospiraceae bacterium]